MTVHIYTQIGTRGQLSLDRQFPWHRDDQALIRHLTQYDIVVVGKDVADFMAPLLEPRRPIVFESEIKTAEEMKKDYRRRYYDKDIWLLGGEAAFRDWAPHVDGRVILSVVPYNGFADEWFPFSEYSIDPTPNKSLKVKKMDWILSNGKPSREVPDDGP